MARGWRRARRKRSPGSDPLDPRDGADPALRDGQRPDLTRASSARTMGEMDRSEEPEPPHDLRAALRLRTAAAHRRLDGLPQQRALVRSGLTLVAYAGILAAHARAHVLCEAWLARVAAARPGDLAPYRSRLPALRSDLARLPAVPMGTTDREAGEAQASVGLSGVRSAEGAKHPAVEGSGQEVDAPHEPLVAEGRYLGLRYVLDGATQGALWIAPRLAENLPALSEDRFAYWRLQQEEAGAWPEVTRVLAARPADGRLAHAAVAAASEAFDAFLDAFAPTQGAEPRDGAEATRRENVP